MDDLIQKQAQSLESTTLAVDSFATVLSCITEFSSIEQALAVQDENDRQKLELIG